MGDKLSYLPALDDAKTPLSEQQLNILEQQVQSEQPNPSVQSQFNYAWGLIKSSDRTDNKQGIDILVDIYKNVPQRRRECLYYLSIGSYKIEELSDAKRYVDALLNHEPDNLQAAHMKKMVEDKISKGGYWLLLIFTNKSDGFIGLAIVSGGVAVGAGLLAAFLRKRH